VSVVWLAATAATGVFGAASPARIQRIREQATSFADTRPRQDAFATLGTPVTENVGEMKRRWATSARQIEMAYSVAVFGPALILLGVMAVRRARAAPEPLIRWASVALVVAAVVGPLLLHVVAWDMHRWNALAALNAGLAALILLGQRETPNAGGVHTALAPAMLAAAVIVTLWGVSSDPVFFDGYRPTHPPFSDQIEVLINGLREWQADDWIPPIGN
jgi:hypothetical protein